ncbi:glutamate--tRNA ligase, partial [candidate division WOR-3 bacterium]|nr:glutamate--tRNA ligase [candidate division WOR-3 bacterium]
WPSGRRHPLAKRFLVERWDGSSNLPLSVCSSYACADYRDTKIDYSDVFGDSFYDPRNTVASHVMIENVRVRMAPSPTGFFHVGSARTALYNWLFARHHGGKFILRVEDTDPKRSSPEMINVILDGMKWLSLDWDEEYYQSRRFELYREYVQNLIDSGKAYYCYCDPEKLEKERQEAYKKKINWQYDRRCLNLSKAEKEIKEKEGAPRAVRFIVPQGTVKYNDMIHGEIVREASDIEDFVILRHDHSPTYNLACVADDADMKISHVIRAVDHITNTPKQILLYQALGLPAPKFAHLPLILGKDKSKLSKRHGATSLMEYRDQGFLPEAVFNYLALLGWSPGNDKEIFMYTEKWRLGGFDRDSIIEAFTLDRASKSNAVFDLEKLIWINQQYIHNMNHARFKEKLISALHNYKVVTENNIKTTIYRDDIRRILQPRLKIFSDVTKFAYFFREDFEYDEKALNKYMKTEIINHIKAYTEIIKNKPPDKFDAGHLEGELRFYAGDKKISPAKIIHPLRVLITGREEGAGLFETMEYIGKATCIARIEKILKR